MNIFFLLQLAFASISTFASPPADLIFYNGNIVTLEKKAPQVEAIAIYQDRIIALGENSKVLKLAGPSTRKIDLNKKLLVPGFIDSHVHLSGLGFAKAELSFETTSSEEEVVEIVRKKASETPAEKWILGGQWNQNKWPSKAFPVSNLLSKASHDHPVFLSRVDGHAAWVNERALKIAGIDQKTPDPDGGKILRDADGKPTGILIDKAMGLVGKHIPDPTKTELRSAIESTFTEISSLGLTSVHNAGTNRDELEVLRDLARENKLPFRVYALLSGRDKKLVDEYFARGRETGLYGSFLTVRGVKMFADGALGSRGARLLHPYHDDPNNRGLLLTEEEELYKLSLRALNAGFQIATHAIGDEANRQVLNAYERALKEYPTFTSPRFRIEHAQIIDPKDIPRFANLGVIPSMQATHATSDMPWVHARVGEDLAKKGAYAWRALIKGGAKIANGSDAPVESIAPIPGFYAAVTRQDSKGNPPGGWHPEQRMTREEALRSFTSNGAYAAFEENEKGSLAVGKLADLVVLSQDILRVPAEKILATKILFTVTAGKIVYERRE